jgi:hypothetical protein
MPPALLNQRNRGMQRCARNDGEAVIEKANGPPPALTLTAGTREDGRRVQYEMTTEFNQVLFFAS